MGGDFEPPFFGLVESHFFYVFVWESNSIDLIVLENESVLVKNKLTDEDNVVENISVLLFDWHETVAVIDDKAIFGSQLLTQMGAFKVLYSVDFQG